MKAYNYSIAEDYKGKLVIPYIGIELEGWLPLIASILGIITITFILGFPLSFLFGGNGFFISLAVSLILVFAIVMYTNEVNNESGKTKLIEFYYLNIKNYRCIYNSKGDKHYIQPKKKGVIYIACR